MTTQHPDRRRLAAIMAVDMVGFSRQMERDEASTLARVKSLRADMLEPQLAAHGGRLVKYLGDGCLVEFASAGDAVDCALGILEALGRSNADLPEDQRIHLRIGVNLGDVVPDRDDIFGDGVNLAAWLESIAPTDGIVISGAVRDQLVGGKAYRFVDLGHRRSEKLARPVHVLRLYPPDETSPRRANGRHAAVGRSRLSILVLPFRMLGGAAEDEYFAEGITEDVITDLSRIPDSFVIARNTAYAYKDEALDMHVVGRELGVRYALEGSVRRAAGTVRVNAKLIDTTNGAHLWAGRFDSHERDLLELQDELTGRIAASLDYQLTDLESRRMLAELPDNLDAVDLTMRGWSVVNKPTTRERLGEARRLFEAALALEPDYAHAEIGLAETLVYEVGHRYSTDPKAQLLRAEKTILHALALEPRHARGHHVRGIQLRLMMQFDPALAAFERALALNRNLASAHAQIGFAKLLTGLPEATVPHIEKAIRLSPRDFNLGAWLCMIGGAHLLMAEERQAIEVLHRAAIENPSLPLSYYLMAGAYALTGEIARAKAALGEFDRLMPNMTVKRLSEGWSSHPDFLRRIARFREGLLLAGMRPE